MMATINKLKSTLYKLEDAIDGGVKIQDTRDDSLLSANSYGMFANHSAPLSPETHESVHINDIGLDI